MPSLVQTIGNEYIAATNAYSPAGASSRGFHEHDARLGDRSAGAISARMDAVRAFLRRIAAVDRSALTGEEPYEIDLLERRMKWELTDYEHVRSWQRGPGGYLTTIGSGCNGLVIRDFAPLDDRLRALTSRLQAAPGLLDEARANLREPSRYHVETAIEAAAGMRALFLRDLPAAASGSADTTLRAEFDAANTAALAAVDEFAAWLKNDLLPRANEDFAWGAETMRKLLSETDSIDEPLDVLIKRGEEDLRAHQELLKEVAAKIDPGATPAEVVDAVSREHNAPEQLLPDVEALLEDLRQFSIDEPLDMLIKRGEEDLRAHQELLKEVAAKIDPNATPAEVVDAVSREHNAPEQLLPDVEALLEDLRQFSIDAKLCTMPTDVRISVTETPGFARMTTQAACSTPGPFETVAKEAYYYVTPPDSAWPAERIESYMKFFNRYSVAGVSAHEAYPGHYVHLTYLHRAKSRIGRFLLSITPIEGWAHYVEQVMIEAGYGGGEPKFHLMQIREALLRLARYRCAFGLHAEGWSIPQAVEFFVREGFTSQIIAERETRRGVIGPNYYAYTMGKHQILALRDKLRARDGASFDQRRFHDDFMQLPYPVATIEKMMLASD